MPTMFGNGVYISASPGRVEMTHPQAAERTIWMNGGGPRPRPGELFQHGFSVGRFDGDDLVVETTNFTFDPDGMDDHLHMASSVRKKVTERYHLDRRQHHEVDHHARRPDVSDEAVHLRVPVRQETGRSRAFVAIVRSRSSARREVEFAYPGNKYPDGK